MTTLADLADMLNRLVEEVEYLDAQTYSDTLEGVEGAFEVKAEKVVYAIRGIERRAELMKHQLNLFKERIHTVEQNAHYLRTYLQHGLESSGKRRLETPAFSMSLRKHTAVIITSEEDLPSQLMRSKTTTAPDKIEIGKQLKAGEMVPGAQLEHRTTLTITGAEHGEPE
jgi:hypothetical protein